MSEGMLKPPPPRTATILHGPWKPQNLSLLLHFEAQRILLLLEQERAQEKKEGA